MQVFVGGWRGRWWSRTSKQATIHTAYVINVGIQVLCARTLHTANMDSNLVCKTLRLPVATEFGEYDGGDDDEA